MALQGTIDAFPLVDVVQLLGASRKTGRLTVDGDRGTGRIWVVDGELVAAEHRGSAVDDGVAALAELLRPATGAFVFDPGEEAAEAGLVPVPLLELLAEASSVLEEWRSIEAVVPSRLHRLVPAPELPEGEDQVTLDARDWQLVVAAARGVTVGELGDELGLAELEVGRAVVAMVERSLVSVAEPHDDDAELGVGPVAGGDDAVPPIDLLAEQPAEASFPDHFPIDDLVAAGEDEDPWSILEGDEDRFAAAQPFAEPGHDPAGADPSPSAFSDPAPFEGTAFGASAFSDAPAPEQVPEGPADVAAPAFDGASFDGGAFDAPFDGSAFDGSAFDTAPTPEAQAPSAFEVRAFDAPAFDAPAFDAPAFDPAFGAEPPAGRAFQPTPADSDPSAAGEVEDASDVADEVDGTEEILRQMSRLSPKAADAIAAALGSASDASTDGSDADSADGR